MNRLALALAGALLAACAGHRTAPAPVTPGPAAPPAVREVERDPQTLRYAAGSGRYRVEQESHVTQEMMGQLMQIDATTRQVLTAVLAEDADGLQASLTVDSLEVTTSQPLDRGAALDAVRGRTFRLRLSPSGRAGVVSSGDSADPLVTQFGSELRTFFPQLPAGPLSTGQTWTDTVSSTRSGEMTVTSRAVRTHRVVGWEDRDSARVLHIEVSAEYTVEGSGETQGTAIEMRGGGRALADAFVSAGGVFVAAAERDSALINATVPAMGVTIPIRQARRSSVIRVR